MYRKEIAIGPLIQWLFGQRGIHVASMNKYAIATPELKVCQSDCSSLRGRGQEGGSR